MHARKEGQATLDAAPSNCMALGATTLDVLRMITGAGMKPVAIGTAAALLLSRVIASQLYGVTPTDPATFFTAAIAFLGVVIGSAPPRRGRTAG